MDGGEKKRKMEDNIDEGENEEEKMDKFFALIKSTRELKERMLTAAQLGKKKDREQQAKTKQVAPPWNPTFRPEDFMDLPLPPPPPMANDTTMVPAAATSPSEEKNNQENRVKNGEEEDLDLNLSL